MTDRRRISQTAEKNKIFREEFPREIVAPAGELKALLRRVHRVVYNRLQPF